MAEKITNPWLQRFAVFAVASTLCLIGIGGVVTSTGSGMTVPDWPNSYGYNMFLFPISLWEGGIFYEHSHRLVASFVGFLTIILAGWLQLSPGVDKTTRIFGWSALALVIFQGVLGGLRVTLIEKQIGIFHAVIAQSFLILLGVIAYRTSRIFQRRSDWVDPVAARRCGQVFLLLTGLMIIQLALGATMRHQHEGLAVTTFPDAYGEIFPDISDNALATLNFDRENIHEIKPVSRLNIIAHMGHRFLAYFLLLASTVIIGMGLKSGFFRKASLAPWIPISWCCLMWGQGMLGVITILKNKPADIATGHVIIGAVSLLGASLMTKHCFHRAGACHKVALTSPTEIPHNQSVRNTASISNPA